MTSLVSPVVPVKAPRPASTHAYFDKVAFWLPCPLDKAVLKQLRANAGHVHVGNRRARFNPRLVQRIELKQPSENALRALAAHPGAYVNRAEVALDLIFKNVRERDDCYEFLDRHLVRRWHGRKQQIRVHPGEAGTRYDAVRSAANAIVVYREKHSRICGEVDCLHIEWRASKRRAVQALGISSPRDLLRFDHRQFWEQRLLLFTVEAERIGALFRGRKRTGRPVKSDGNARRGMVVLDSVENIQELLDRYRETRIRRVLTKIGASPLLPTLPGETPHWTSLTRRKRRTHVYGRRERKSR
jgi:hypothetical protein